MADDEEMAASPSAPSAPGRLLRSTLRGHRASVLCLAADPARARLASGSSDGTCRLWDLRVASGAVRSVRAAAVGGEVSAVALSARDEHLMLAASGCDLVGFDLRSERVLLQEPAQRVVGLAAEEINQVVVEPSGATAAVAEDGGAVHLVDLHTWQRERSFAGKHGHRSICSSVAFRPGRTWGLASGGDESGAGAAGPQLCNPPWVHSVAYMEGGEALAAALGDGSLALLDAESGGVLHRLRGGHASTVCQVLSTPFGLMSAGNDCHLCSWTSASERGAPPRLSLRAEHPEKVNWLAWLDGRLFVADLSNNIACYEGFGC
mmetsp:Transcript_126151/g.403226  ORF Transcript_126151/g.403226 Transcript_126151/m.403226 type:complete len:320 (-) Transcript_126151:34-993(-)